MSTSSKNIEGVLRTLNKGEQIRIITESGSVYAEVYQTDPQLKLRNRDTHNEITLSQDKALVVANLQNESAPITSIKTT